MRFISVTCVVWGKIASLDSARGEKSDSGCKVVVDDADVVQSLDRHVRSITKANLDSAGGVGRCWNFFAMPARLCGEATLRRQIRNIFQLPFKHRRHSGDYDRDKNQKETYSNTARNVIAGPNYK
jgi:hypothetical protein